MLGPQSAHICSWPGQMNFFLLSFLAFKQTKQQVLFKVKPLNMFNTKIVALHQVNKQHFKEKCWIWGPIRHNMPSAPIFFFKNHSILLPTFTHTLYSRKHAQPTDPPQVYSKCILLFGIIIAVNSHYPPPSSPQWCSGRPKKMYYFIVCSVHCSCTMYIYRAASYPQSFLKLHLNWEHRKL